MEQLDNQYKFQAVLKQYAQEGNLVYEYNPFHNYRLDHDMVYYKSRLLEFSELADELGVLYFDGVTTYPDENQNITKESEKGFYTKEGELITSWNQIIPKTETPPIVYPKYSLVDFETDELHFSLENPVNILPQYSYDNSVNLILNDGLNPPKLINSRFSATERNKYQVCNRKGNNDSNIYDQGDQFNIDTSLYKKLNRIPRIKYLGVGYGGNLSVGNYHFYFRYVDDDGNMSDFFGESGLVSVFIGNAAGAIHTGFRDQNSHKLVKFQLSNTDPGYQKVIIYYTKSTSDIDQNQVTSVYKINTEYKLLVNNSSTTISINGYEDISQVDISEINPTYQIYGSAETQEQAQNILFLGNLDKPKVDYEDLADCALRFLPYLDTSKEYPLEQIGKYYTGSISGTYCDPTYIYNFTGYHYGEIYRLGIVFIYNDNTLSEVFNIRGINELSSSSDYTSYSLKNDNGERQFINFDEQYYTIFPNDNEDRNSILRLENAKGVIRIVDNGDFSSVLGIRIEVEEEVIEYLHNVLGVNGFFFVRQKRIPTTICQAYTIGVDKQSNTPVIPIDSDKYVTERFLSNDRLLTNNDQDHYHEIDEFLVREEAAICPEYDVNSPYLNTLFTGADFVIQKQCDLNLSREGRFYISNTPNTIGQNYTTSKIIGVEDNVKLVGIENSLFSARAGEAEEAFRFEYIGEENISTEAHNLLRGSFGPYLGITNTNKDQLIDIKIPGYNLANMQDYFLIRYNDKSPYYAISDRINIDNINYTTDSVESKKFFSTTVYRGDCYICQFTHRFNRNFQDPSSPTNDKIVDPNCWRDNFEVSDGVIKTENFERINLGDVNAVQLGLYITLYVRSTFNLNIRSLDDSNVDETSMFGHPRGFYPYFTALTDGTYKIPEALCINKGFEKSVSEKVHFEVPDVPWIKNEFSNRIAYSRIQIKDAFENGWRTFDGQSYRDYPKTYGSITKLVELRGNLVCVFEHGVAIIPVNERAIAASGAGGNAYINTSNVLPENPNILSDKFGSQWRESIIKTPKAIYGVDTIAKKIWRTNGQVFECISDFKVQEFLNQNISLTERELTPIVGIRNVKTHFNKFKNDVMFTFYDNLYDFEEKVWNLCWNENLEQWITFYSWIPSYSENIYNQLYSFNRDTSKWIAKLGISNSNNDFSDGVTLSNNIIPNNSNTDYEIGQLSLSNRTLPTGDNIKVTIYYTLERDNYQNYKNFKIKHYRDGQEVSINEIISDTSGVITASLYLNTDATDLCTELYIKETEQGEQFKITKDNYTNQYSEELTIKQAWISNCVSNNNWSIYKDDQGRRVNIPLSEQINNGKIVYLLNMQAHILVNYTDEATGVDEVYTSSFKNGLQVDAGYYKSTIAVIPKYNMQFLTTDFWKHGQAGIIDIADKINPTYWYGKQHPFEFEFIVADNPDKHKIFDNLQIISNNAEPESFHYEVVGDVYDFAKDKKNMYIRQEATKEFYQYNGMDIMYDHSYTDLTSEHRILNSANKLYDKSSILPLYYSRQDTINEVEDSYHLKTEINQDFSNMSGSEIKHYKTLDEYRIWNHSKAVDLNTEGRLRGNMQYNEDKWLVQINPINIRQTNEQDWSLGDLLGRSTSSDKIPIELGQSPIPDEVLEKGNITKEDIPENSKDRAIVVWNNIEEQSVKVKDKWMKVRIRYSGNKLAVITAIQTLFSISYS